MKMLRFIFTCNFFIEITAISSDIFTENYDNLVKSNLTRWPRVLNFFPVPVEEECAANDGRRRGICLNSYECKMKGGKSFGFCALGFGVCCIFTATCDQEISNNLTYFLNPGFPDLLQNTKTTNCNLVVKKLDEKIAQIRLDFIHFNLGQPNRGTGVCDEDIFIINSSVDSNDFELCGFNSGQHVFIDVDREEDSVRIIINLSQKSISRFWEIKITQIPFSIRAPTGCLQYYEGFSGTFQTFNFAENGRHLSDQDYNICIRQEEDTCGVAYEPCHRNAFKIAPNNADDGDFETGSGNFENADCKDGILVPCDVDELMPSQTSTTADDVLNVCDTIRCGSNLCVDPDSEAVCRIESSTTPFVVGVRFGSPNAVTPRPPDENIGMCLNYQLIGCDF